MESNSLQPGPEHPEKRGTPVDDAAVKLAELLMIKPKWRGWIHTATTPLALAAGLVLVILAPTPDLKIACAVYAVTGVLLFGVSAVYHRGNWSPRVKMVLKRLDHTNIMLVIAGSYTPLAWALLDRQKAEVLLWVIWSGAILGVLFRVLWTNAPRWLYVPIYIALGCGALFYLPDFFAANVACGRADLRWRRAVYHRSRLLRPEETELQLPALRLSRAVPCPDGPGIRRALHRHCHRCPELSLPGQGLTPPDRSACADSPHL